MESKITQFGSRFAEKLKSKNYVENPNVKREKTKIISKINLIYNSKSKDNDIRRKIRRKAQILPEIALEMIQLIAGSKAFHYAIQKMIIGIQ